MKTSPLQLYDKLVLGKPVATLLLVFLITAKTCATTTPFGPATDPTTI